MTHAHLVMHGIAVKKHGSAEAIAQLIGLSPAETGATLERLVSGGRVMNADQRYLLTPAGRMILDSQYSRFCAAARADDSFIAAHQRFEIVNNELKQVITDWQMMNVGGQQVANDHSDADYDNAVIDRLGGVHEKVNPILKSFATVVPRFGYYLDKLETALEKAEDGVSEWVSDATIDSYHTVWFELHEDILRVLGHERQE